VDGRFIVDLEDRSIDLHPQQGIVVPKGVNHRTRSPEPSVILMVETAGDNTDWRRVISPEIPILASMPR
jgi:mannose-6-phosphate isomerase-like protein (cupin superfamily)